MWGGDISHSRTDNRRQHHTVTTVTTTNYNYNTQLLQNYKLLSINTTTMKFRIFSDTIFLIKAKHVVKLNMTVGKKNISWQNCLAEILSNIKY